MFTDATNLATMKLDGGNLNAQSDHEKQINSYDSIDNSDTLCWHTVQSSVSLENVDYVGEADITHNMRETVDLCWTIHTGFFYKICIFRTQLLYGKREEISD